MTNDQLMIWKKLILKKKKKIQTISRFPIGH